LVSIPGHVVREMAESGAPAVGPDIGADSAKLRQHVGD
jgi:hypothetical protein